MTKNNRPFAAIFLLLLLFGVNKTLQAQQLVVTRVTCTCPRNPICQFLYGDIVFVIEQFFYCANCEPNRERRCKMPTGIESDDQVKRAAGPAGCGLREVTCYPEWGHMSDSPRSGLTCEDAKAALPLSPSGGQTTSAPSVMGTGDDGFLESDPTEEDESCPVPEDVEVGL